MKICSSCNQTKPYSQFSKKARENDGYDYYCKQCKSTRASDYYKRNKKDIRVKQKEWDRKNKRQKRGYYLRKTYGVTNKQYEIMLAKQNRTCAICNKMPDKNLFVDHDHQTGEVRGLLCHTCNIALGHFQDDPELLKSAIDYLAKIRVKTTEL